MMKRLAGVSVLFALVAYAFVILPNTLSAQQQAETISRCRSEGVSSVAIDVASTGNNELVALTAGQQVHVCGFVLEGGGTVEAQFITGTGTACATDEANLTGNFPLIIQTVISVPNTGATQFKGATASALCLELSGNVAVDGVMQYVKY